MGFRSNQSVICYPYDICVTNVVMGMSCLASYYCGLQSSQLSKIDDYSSLLVTCIALPSTLQCCHKLVHRDEASKSVPACFHNVI